MNQINYCITPAPRLRLTRSSQYKQHFMLSTTTTHKFIALLRMLLLLLSISQLAKREISQLIWEKKVASLYNSKEAAERRSTYLHSETEHSTNDFHLRFHCTGHFLSSLHSINSHIHISPVTEETTWTLWKVFFSPLCQNNVSISKTVCHVISSACHLDISLIVISKQCLHISQRTRCSCSVIHSNDSTSILLTQWLL